MTNKEREALAQKVADVFAGLFAKLSEHRTDIEALWHEFEILRRDETIMGCHTKTEFSVKVLHRNIRTIQYMVYGRGEQSSRTEDTRGLRVEDIIPEETRKKTLAYDPVLYALYYAQTEMILQMGNAETEEEKYKLLHAAATLEGKIVAHILRRNDGRDDDDRDEFDDRTDLEWKRVEVD